MGDPTVVTQNSEHESNTNNLTTQAFAFGDNEDDIVDEHEVSKGALDCYRTET